MLFLLLQLGSYAIYCSRGKENRKMEGKMKREKGRRCTVSDCSKKVIPYSRVFQKYSTHSHIWSLFKEEAGRKPFFVVIPMVLHVIVMKKKIKSE